MPAIAHDLARRIDQLAWRAHAFHRFAHHPLCLRYAPELVAVGRSVRICRGCLLGGLGGLLGLLAGLALRPAIAVALSSLVLSAALALASRIVRLPKLLGRLLPAAAGAFAATGGILLASVAAAFGVGWLLAYRRAGPDRSLCHGCPEHGDKVCSGLGPIVRRERAFQRLTGRWLARRHAIRQAQ